MVVDPAPSLTKEKVDAFIKDGGRRALRSRRMSPYWGKTLSPEKVGYAKL